MPQIRHSAWLGLPVLLLLVLYWPGLNTWFYQDDFGWLNLRHDVNSARDLAGALLAPKAHGNMRPLGENAYWLGLSAVFGVAPLPFHICTFLTQSASLLLLGGIVRRLVAWGPAALMGIVENGPEAEFRCSTRRSVTQWDGLSTPVRSSSLPIGGASWRWAASRWNERLLKQGSPSLGR